MSSFKRRVSLSRRHMQQRNSFSDVRQELLPDAVHPNAYDGSTDSVRESSDPLHELDKLGLPRSSSLGESLDKLDHEESTDDDGASYQHPHTSPSPFAEDTESSSMDEAGIFYEMTPDFSAALQGRDTQSERSDVNSSQDYYFCVKNSRPASSSLSTSSGTLSIPGDANSLPCYPDVVYPDQLYDDLNMGAVHDPAYSAVTFTARENGSSGESGCDTEGTVKAASDDDDCSVNDEQNCLKIEANRELLESGFTEDFHPSVSSVYDEEAVINIHHGFQDSDSDIEDAQSIRSGQRSQNDQGSCVSFSTSYPDSFYRHGDASETCYSSDVTTTSHDRNVKKSKLIRRPHVKASQSPLLARRKNNVDTSSKTNVAGTWDETSRKCSSRPGDMEIELERPSKEITDDEHEEETDTEANQQEEDYCQEITSDDKENATFKLLRGVKSVFYRGDREADNKSSVVESEVENSDAEYCRIMEKTMELEFNKTKWTKTKEQILKLLRERLLVLKKVIQDKNIQIRQLKSRLKLEQQNSQIMAEKLKVSFK